jgi:hypothetical protein
MPDGALLFTRYGRTEINEHSRFIGDLETFGAQVLGVMLALTPSKKGDTYSDSYKLHRLYLRSQAGDTAGSRGRRLCPETAPKARGFDSSWNMVGLTRS